MWLPLTTGVEHLTSWFVNRILVKQKKQRLDPEKLWDYFQDLEADDPQSFFGAGDVSAPSPGWFRPRRGRVDFSFPTALPSGDVTNDTVRGVSVLHPDYRRGPHVVLLHGWITPGHQQSLWVAKEFLRYGISTHMLELPYHMRRSPRGYFSGTRVIDPDFSILLDALRQGVADTRKLIAGLRAEGFQRVGLMGISLGGYTSGLVASLEEGLDSLTLAAPLVDLGYTLYHSPMIAVGREMISHIDSQELLEKLAPLRLTHYTPRLERERILLINSMHDKVVYPHKVQELWRAWEQPLMFKESHGHVTFFFSRESFQRIAAYLGHPRSTRFATSLSPSQSVASFAR